jgi:uncharacterized protein GlcG (DUF336 family)
MIVAGARDLRGVETRPILTSGAAMKMIQACTARAKNEGWRMHVAVMDNSGRLKAYLAMDDAQAYSQESSIGKARTAAMSPRSTKERGDAAFPGGIPNASAFLPGLILVEGGLPIRTASGYHIGGIGVSGSSAANDAVCAQTGIDAAKDDLR